MDNETTDGFCLLRVEQGAALTGRNTTGPPCSVTVELLLDCRRHDVIAWHARVKPPAGSPWSVTDGDRRRRQTATDTSDSMAPTACVGGPVIMLLYQQQKPTLVQYWFIKGVYMILPRDAMLARYMLSSYMSFRLSSVPSIWRRCGASGISAP